MAQVRKAELAAQKFVTALGSDAPLRSAIDGRARPAPANPVATRAPAPFATRRPTRPGREKPFRFAMLQQ